MIVAVEQARRTVAGDEDVRPSVIVEVGSRGPHAVRTAGLPIPGNEDHGRRPTRASDARLLRHVYKCTVSAIAVKNIGATGEAQRSTRHRDIVVHAVRSSARL